MKRIAILVLVSIIGSNIIMANSNATTNFPYPSLKKETVSLESFFRSYDTVVLKRIISIIPIEDEPARLSNEDLQYMINKNIELISLLSSHRPTVYNPGDMQPDDAVVVYAGLIELSIELEYLRNSANRFPWRCIGDVILASFNVASIIDDYRALVNSGASWGTVRSFLWRTLKRYGGFFAAAGVLYDIATECF